jgi:hypothetical protein
VDVTIADADLDTVPARPHNGDPELAVVSEPLPSHLTTMSAWSAEVGYHHTAVLSWQRRPGFPAPVGQFRRASGGTPTHVYNRSDLAAYLSAGHTAHGLPVIEEPLPDDLVTLAKWARDIGRRLATVRGWRAELDFPRPVAMVHGVHAAYQLAALAAYLTDPRRAGYPVDQPLPDGLTTLDAWAADIGFAPSTVRSWSHERDFPAPVAGRGRQSVYRRADLDAYRKAGSSADQCLPAGLTTLADWAVSIRRSPNTVRGWIAERDFPAPVAGRGRQSVYRRADLDAYRNRIGLPLR